MSTYIVNFFTNLVLQLVDEYNDSESTNIELKENIKEYFKTESRKSLEFVMNYDYVYDRICEIDENINDDKKYRKIVNKLLDKYFN